MKCHRLFFKPDKAVPQFRRLRFEEVDVPLPACAAARVAAGRRDVLSLPQPPESIPVRSRLALDALDLAGVPEEVEALVARDPDHDFVPGVDRLSVPDPGPAPRAAGLAAPHRPIVLQGEALLLPDGRHHEEVVVAAHGLVLAPVELQMQAQPGCVKGLELPQDELGRAGQVGVVPVLQVSEPPLQYRRCAAAMGRCAAVGPDRPRRIRSVCGPPSPSHRARAAQRTCSGTAFTYSSVSFSDECPMTARTVTCGSAVRTAGDRSPPYASCIGRRPRAA